MQIASLCQVLSNGVPILNLTIEEGSIVNKDRANLIRGSCTLTCTDPSGTLVASTAKDVLKPYGNELALYYGTVFADGTTELVQLGIFVITDRTVDDTGTDLVITIDGADRARSIQRDLFTDVFSIPPGTNVGLAIQSIILSRNVSPLVQQFNFAPTTFVTPITPIVYNPGDDPLAAIADPQNGLAASAGMEFFYDPNGIATLIPIPDPTMQPLAWSYDEGPNNLASEISVVDSTDAGYNVVIVDGVGSGIDPPVTATWTNNDPSSPEWVGNPSYGEVVQYIPSSLVATQAQAQVAANAAGLIAKGSTRTITLTALVKPDHDIDDVIEVTRIRAGVGPGSLFVIDSFSITFGTGGTLQANCRSVTA